MELPKLTKKVADEIRDNYQKFLKNEELKEALREDDMLKAKALADYLGENVEDVENTGINLYTINGDEFFVVTEEEAEEEAGDQIRNLFDDIGMDSFTDSFKDWIINNAIDDREIYNWMEDSYRGYVEDIENENDIEYGNRLIQELYDNDILTDDDFEVDEYGETLYDTLKDGVDLESKKDEYVEQLIDGITPLEFLRTMYNDEEIGKILEENGIINPDEVIEECIREDGLAHFLATWDSKELDLGNGLFAYRVS